MRKARSKNLDLGILAVRRHSQLQTHETGILRPGSLVVSLMCADLGTYHAKFYYSYLRPHKYHTRNYVTTSAENGPAMVGPAGPVPAPISGVSKMT